VVPIGVQYGVHYLCPAVRRAGLCAVVSESPQQVLGSVQASAPDERMREAWEEGARLVAEVGAGVIDALRIAFDGMDEVTVESVPILVASWA
jgi:hypothetical protein